MKKGYISCNRSVTGFTLAELLIALAILGVIATFTIPKVLQNQQNSEKAAVFKETIATLNSVFNTGIQRSEVTESNFGTYILDRINAVKICRTNAVTEGCWTTGVDPVAGQASQAGAILHNGATLSGFDDNAIGGGYDFIVIDWNGPDGPNVEGDDVMVMKAVFNSAGGNRVGTVREDASYPLSKTLWSQVFQ